MPQGVRKCKVCGKEYQYCKTNRPAGMFRYQDVACSPEHATIYFSRIAASRSKNAVAGDIEEDSVLASMSVDESDEDDEFFEEDFDDDEEEPEIEL